MNKILRYSFMALLAMMVGNVMADEATMKYSGSTTANMKADGSNEAASVGLNDSEWSVVASKGAASNAPGLNKAGDIRLYWHADGGNTITVSSLTNATISNIAITFTGAEYSNVSVTANGAAVTGTDGNYAINSTSFILGNANTSNAQVRISQIVITYAGGTPVTVVAPKFSVESGLYFETQTVALTCETEGAKILYTIPAGQDPEYTDDNNFTGVFYDGTPLTISQNTIIKAMAIKDGQTSNIVTAKYTIVNTTGKGTVESPFSVADALQVVAALDKSATTSESYYVKGFVVGTPDIQKKEDGTYYGNANFTIADTKGGADLLTCFRLKGLENENIESDDYVQENDEVLLVGQLQKYVKNDEETPEIKNGHIVSITRPEIVVVPEPVVEGTKIAEMDYTTAAQYPYYRMEPTNPEAGNFDVKDGALVISATAAQANMWEMQPFILDWFNIKAGNNYNIAIYMEATSDVDLWLGFGTWAGSMALYGQKANAARGWNYYTVENATAECATSENNAHILFQCGSFVGTIKIYKVELYEVESTGINNVKANVENAVRYNLAGQKVNNGFKGVVIMNGKKMLQK